MIIALLGYGLVEIPRILWRRSFPESRLKWHYHRVGRSGVLAVVGAPDSTSHALASPVVLSWPVPLAPGWTAPQCCAALAVACTLTAAAALPCRVTCS